MHFPKKIAMAIIFHDSYRATKFSAEDADACHKETVSCWIPKTYPWKLGGKNWELKTVSWKIGTENRKVKTKNWDQKNGNWNRTIGFSLFLLLEGFESQLRDFSHFLSAGKYLKNQCTLKCLGNRQKNYLKHLWYITTLSYIRFTTVHV